MKIAIREERAMSRLGDPTKVNKMIDNKVALRGKQSTEGHRVQLTIFSSNLLQ
jgi:hypothetical protein